MRVPVQVFSAMPDDPPPLPLVPGRKCRCVGDGQQRDVKGIQEHNEAVVLVRGVRFHDAAEFVRVGGGDAGHHAVKTGKSHHHVGRKIFFQFKKGPVIYDQIDDFVNIIGEFRVVRHHIQQGVFPALRVIAGLDYRGLFTEILGDEGQQLFDLVDGLFIAVSQQIALAAFFHVKFG